MDIVKCANCNIVINEVLCFVQNKIDVMNSVSLSLLCRQSFNEDEILKAKRLLFESIPQRLVKRKGEDRKSKNIEDIMGILRGSDPENIPIFVARDLQKLPPVTFDHVDVTRLLKDITLLQSQVMSLQNKQEDYITRTEFEKQILRKESNLYVNTRRGGSCLQDDAISEQRESACESQSDKSPSVTRQKQVIDNQYPLYANVAAMQKENVASVTSVLSVPQTQRDGIQFSNNLRKPNLNAMAPAPQVTDKQNGEDDWIRVNKKKKRFRGMRGTASVDTGTKLKAADIQIPLYIYNISKENTERDVAEYVYAKTQINIVPEKINMKSSRDNNSFKFYVLRSKMSLFMDNSLWPEGIYFRKYFLFGNRNKTSVDQHEQLNVYEPKQKTHE